MSKLNIVRLYDSTPVYDQLRGGSTLRTLSMPNVYGSIINFYEPKDGGITVPSTGVVFCDLAQAMGPYSQVVADDLIAGSFSHLPLILDIHFPFWDIENIIGLQPGERVAQDTDATRLLHEFWSKPQHIDKATMLVQAAYAVTASQSPWAGWLTNLNDNTAYLLDVHSTNEAVEFTKTLLPIFGSAFTAYYSIGRSYDQLTMWNRLRLGIQKQSLRLSYSLSTKMHRQELDKLPWEYQD